MSVNSQPFRAADGNAGHVLADFFVLYYSTGVAPLAPLPLTDVTLEDMDGDLGAGWYRLLGLSDPADAGAQLVVTTSTDVTEVLLKQDWPDTTILNELHALFSPMPGNVPITLLILDATSALPISGVTVSIWNANSSQVIIPTLTTNTAGKVVMSLPAGTYSAYLFKPFAVFAALPRSFTVVAGPATTFTMTGSDSVVPTQPTISLVTVFGYVVYPNGVVAQGVEVKMRLKQSPQMVQSAAFSKAFVAAITDADGYFEINCAANLNIVLECETVGYSRQGKLPASGSINWKDFAVSTI